MSAAALVASQPSGRGLAAMLGGWLCAAIALSDSAWKRTAKAVKQWEKFAPRQPKRQPRRLVGPDCRFFIVQDEGPSAEADYTDERYWVQLAEITNSDSDETSKLTFAVIPNTDDRYTYATATNLAEWVGETHNLADGAVVPVFTAYGPASIEVPRRFFNFPA